MLHLLHLISNMITSNHQIKTHGTWGQAKVEQHPAYDTVWSMTSTVVSMREWPSCQGQDQGWNFVLKDNQGPKPTTKSVIFGEYEWSYLSTDMLQFGTFHMQSELLKEQIRLSTWPFSSARPLCVGWVASQRQHPLLRSYTNSTELHKHKCCICERNKCLLNL